MYEQGNRSRLPSQGNRCRFLLAKFNWRFRAARVLIVDNDKNTTHLVKILLEKTGRYLVFEENDSTRAHQTARNFRPDLVFLDVVMPDQTEAKLRHKSERILSCNTRQSFFSQRS